MFKNRKFIAKCYKEGKKVILTYVGNKEDFKHYRLSNKMIMIACNEQGIFEDKYVRIEEKEW